MRSNKVFKKALSLILCVVMVFTSAPLAGLVGIELPSIGDLFASKAEATGKKITDYNVGNIVEFGWYPQSKVTDSSLISQLNATAGDNKSWTSYGYYSGTGGWDNGKMTAGDYMRYIDVILGSNKYRGVIFDAYRPYYTGYTSSTSTSHTYQYSNGYSTGTAYWFKYEPVKWRVLNPKTGMVMSETILDSQAYNNYVLYSNGEYYGDADKTYYANNYAESSIRKWLNEDFYNTAFSTAQQNIIQYTALDNSAYSTSYSEYNSVTTYDKIYLLSYSDALNESYGFSSDYSEYDTDRRAQGSDYAKSQGLWVATSSSYSGNSYWRLRSAGNYSFNTCRVDDDGYVSSYCSTSNTNNGVRLALNLNLSSEIFQSDVKDTGAASASGTGSASVYNRNGAFTITAKQSDYNEKWFKLKNVSANVGSNTVSHKKDDESAFEITREDISDTSRPNIVLRKNGFEDYIIPNVVANSIGNGDNLDAYMNLLTKREQEGKPYISTVFAKNSSEVAYSDLFKSETIAERNNKYDIYISSVGLGSNIVYYIGQDATHKIESRTGYFGTADLYSKLTLNKTVYVWAVDGSGKTTDPKSIMLKKSNDDGSLEKILNTSTYGLGGSGGITIKVPDENPIFGNSEVSLKAFSAPITVYYDTTNDTYIGTIGFDLYSYEKKDGTIDKGDGKGPKKFGEGETKKAFQNFKESFSYLNKKPFAETEEDKNGKSYKEQWESLVKECKDASSGTLTKTRDKNFSTDFLGYLEFAINEQGFVIKQASLKVGAKFSYSYTYQGAVWVIPAYFKATLGAEASLEGSGKRVSADRDLPFEYEITLGVEPKLALEAGIGVEKLIKAGVEAKGTAPIKVEFFDQHFKFDFHGEININTKAFVFEWNKKVCEGDINVVDTYWNYPWQTNSVSLYSTQSGVPQYVVETDEDNTAKLIEYYNASSCVSDRDYLGNMSEWYGDIPSKSKISSKSDINIDTLRESVLQNGKPVAIAVGNKVLMAWVEDCESRDTYNRMRLVYSIYDGETWSAPAAVYDDGKNDDAPALATDGKNVYFAWQKINAVLDENSVVTDALQQVDICVATYSSETNTISNAKIISSNNGYDYAQAITVENGSPVVYFASCADPSVAISFNSKINKYADGSLQTLVSSLSFVHSISANGSDMSYVIDTDGDLSTTNDINVFSYSSGYSSEYDKQDVNSALVASYYGKLNGKNVMFVTDGANIYYDLNGERNYVLESGRNLSSLNLIEQNGNPAFIWTEDNGDESGNTIFYLYYDGSSWTSPVEIYQAEEYYFDSLDMVNFKDNLVGVFMQDAIGYDEESGMNKISQVNLAYITITDYSDLSVGCISVRDEELVPGETASVCVYIENMGTQKINNVEFKITDSLSADQTHTVDVDLLPGESKNVYIDYVVPSTFKQTTLGVSAAISDDIDLTNNSAQTTAGLSHLRLTKVNYVIDGNYYIVTSNVINESLTAAKNITAKLYLNEDEGKVYHEAKIALLSSDEVGTATFYVEKTSLDFDELKTAKLFCCFEDPNSKYGKTATECVLISDSATECAHPLTESREKVEPTVTQVGHKAGEFCLCCEEYISGGEEIAKLEKPTEPSTRPSEPSTKPSETTTKPTEPSTKPSEPTTKPTEPSTNPSEPTTKPSEPAFKFEIGKPSTTTISYGDSIILHADIEGTLPDGAEIVWTADNANFVMNVSSDGTTCKLSPTSSGDTNITATVYDKDGNIVSSDTQKMTSKAGFFDKIIAFFKKLFGLNKVIPQIFKGVIK